MEHTCTSDDIHSGRIEQTTKNAVCSVSVYLVLSQSGVPERVSKFSLSVVALAFIAQKAVSNQPILIAPRSVDRLVEPALDELFQHTITSRAASHFHSLYVFPTPQVQTLTVVSSTPDPISMM